MTRKQAHAEAIGFLTAADEALDQAAAQLRDARTAESVEACVGGRYFGARTASGILADLLKDAQETVCDDCGALIADCPCAWSNQEVA